MRRRTMRGQPFSAKRCANAPMAEPGYGVDLKGYYGVNLKGDGVDLIIKGYGVDSSGAAYY
eukprot:3005865-Pyramimonas_sp.AAC.1